MNELGNNTQFFVAAGLLSALAGIASLLRTDGEVTRKRIAGSFLNSGLLGLAVSMVWETHFRENAYALMGICVLIGLAGNAGVEWIISMMKKGGLTINFGGGKLDTKPNEEEKK